MFKSLPLNNIPFKTSSFLKEIQASGEPFFQARFKYPIAFIITTLNFALTYDFEDFGWIYGYYYLSDLMLTYLTLEFFIIGVHWLDKRQPWSTSINKRLLIQFLVHTPFVLLFIVVSNEVLEWIFYSASVSKTYVAVAMLKLVERGKVSLDEKKVSICLKK